MPGRGEGFSFFRASMKQMFIRSGASREEIEAIMDGRTKTGHRFSIAEQQKVYKEEINRIWNLQLVNLSSTEEPNVSDDELAAQDELEEEDVASIHAALLQFGYPTVRPLGQMRSSSALSFDGNQQPGSQQPSRSASPQRQLLRPPSASGNAMAIDDDMTIETGSVSSSRFAGRFKPLVIRRRFENALGESEWREERISDPLVARAYLKQKRLMELSAGGIRPDDDEETRKRKLQEELRRLRREQSKNKPSAPQTPLTVQEPLAPGMPSRLGGSARICKGCGMQGHIMSNRICPNFSKNFPERAKKLEEMAKQQATKRERIAKAESKAAEGKISINVSTHQQSKAPTPQAASQPPSTTPSIKIRLFPSSGDMQK
jgi:hypothetical protein